VYTVRARLSDVFEKSGRSGPLTVIARRAEIHGADGLLTATVEDRQIVRWRPAEATPLQAVASVRPEARPTPPPSRAARARQGAPLHDGRDDVLVGAALGRPVGAPPARLCPQAAVLETAADAADLEVGALLGPERRLAPAAAAIAVYAQSLGERESLFTDRAFARSLGYADVIVPGPLQSALLEAMLRRHLSGWTLRHLSMTFRISVLADEPIALAAVVVERHLRHDHTALTCDLSLENRDGERAALGTAELYRAATTLTTC
jgi:acyl dehydratase